MGTRKHSPSLLTVLRTPGWPRIVLLRRIAAGVLVLLAAATLLQPAVAPPADAARVVVAKTELVAGEPLTDADVETVLVPVELVPEFALTPDAEIVGSIPIGPVGRGEILTELRLVSDSLVAKISAGDENHSGSHIVSIRPNDPVLVAHLHTGDAVDIVSTQRNSGDARVIAAGGRVITTLNADSDTDAAVLVALSRDEAAEVAAAGLSGPLSLLLTTPQ